MNGILLIDKQTGWTSFDVVAKVRGILKAKQTDKGVNHKKIRVGHAGTLDPLATGLLIILIGDYCKRAQEFSKLDKVYEVEIKLGETSSTDDAEGTVLPYVSPQNANKHSGTNGKIPSEPKIKEVINSFVGQIMQTPPAFSAVKVNGKRAYKLAREGKKVEIKPRKVNIYSIKITDVDYPFVRFTAHVSSGTYIRSLARDIGEKLKTGAYMSNLRRTQAGNYNIKQATTVIDKQIINFIKS